MKWVSIIFMLILKIKNGNLEDSTIDSVTQNNTDVILNLHNTKNITESEDAILRNFKNTNKKKALQTKIVGGFEVDGICSYPYHIKYGITCGGAIIDKKWVITVAHCGQKEAIYVGSKYKDGGTMYRVEKHFPHPRWGSKLNKHDFDYDYQLLQLRDNINFSADVRPVQLGDSRDMVVGGLMNVTGWGRTSENGVHPKVLNVVQVPIVDKATCQKVDFPMFKDSLTSRMFCAGYYEGGKDACQGDSGGAGVRNGRLIGLVSFGYGCATPKSFGVYSDVTQMKSWIRETTGLNF